MAKQDKEQFKQGMDDIFSGVDLVSSVVAQDRKRSGRDGKKAEEDYDNMTSHSVIKQYDNKTNKQAIKQSGNKTESVAMPKATKKLTGRDLLSQRVAEAKKMAQSPTMTVTLRIPKELNEWLDAYTHGAYKEKIKKQDLVIESLRLAFAHRGNYGEEKIPTELLAEE